MNTTTSPRAARRSVLDILLSVVAVLLQLVAGWLVLVSGLLAPLYAIVGLGILWLGSWVPLVRMLRATPLRAPLVPLAFGVLWWVAITVGESVLGWTA